jgi:hypothetical protein
MIFEELMNKLKRITSEYIEAEDRIRIAGLTEKEESLSLWLTMRLTSRLVTHCVALLATHGPKLKKAATSDERLKNNLQGMVQQSAEQEVVKELAVSVSKDSPSLLIREIDVKTSSGGVIMTFKEDETSSYELCLEGQQLRQWLGMLYLIWQKAEWPLHVWPDWMDKSKRNGVSEETSIH